VPQVDYEESKEQISTPKPIAVPIAAAEKRNVIFIIPFAVPGSGKSFCWNIL
jgi:hypothetical protein